MRRDIVRYVGRIYAATTRPSERKAGPKLEGEELECARFYASFMQMNNDS
jgi:hypothetical protein